VLILQVIPPRLEQDAIELQVADRLGGNVADAVGERKRLAAPPVSGTAVSHGQIKFRPRPREIEQVVSVDVPRQNA
jgi:hypothetical protein